MLFCVDTVKIERALDISNFFYQENVTIRILFDDFLNSIRYGITWVIHVVHYFLNRMGITDLGLLLLLQHDTRVIVI